MIPRMSQAQVDRDRDYQNPLVTRYAGREMRELFSPRRRALVWRECWIALARAQRELGLEISASQIEALEARKEDLDLDRVAELEAELRHDVMAHIHHYGEVAPEARGILHLGATSCFVTDNADLWIFREGLRLLARRIRGLLGTMARRAEEWRDLPCLSWTHYQPAQPTTMGRRVCTWAQDLKLDLERIETLARNLPFRGAKGTTGTQASYLSLFDGDHRKVRLLDRKVAEALGFGDVLPLTTQTYPRKLDHDLLAALSGLAQSCARFGIDVRLLSHEGEVEEPFEKKQIGSSAMAYKRNPMRSERICSLARLVLALSSTAGETAANQWLERSLDDSAIRRIAIPEAFLALDACLQLETNVLAGLRVWPRMMERHLLEHLPFMITEEVLMEGVRKGADRQDLHERIRRHAVEAARRMKEEGANNPLLGMLEEDPAFGFIRGRLRDLCRPERLVGRSREQVDEFLEEVLGPILAEDGGAASDEIRV